MIGRIVKGIGGFYYVETGGRLLKAKGRGLFRRQGLTPTVGDICEVKEALATEDDVFITGICPRRNIFSRPPIANVDVLIVVMAVREPVPDLFMIDKLLVMAEKNEAEPLMIISKEDLADQAETDAVTSIYRDIYPTFVADRGDRGWKDEVLDIIGARTAAFAGASGVGKSTLTNILAPGASSETGSISGRTARGRHTTRHVEIFHSGEALIFDTPGFTSFDLAGIEEHELASYFPEMQGPAAGCRFDDCLHLGEPGCAVREALTSKKIAESRYRSYVAGIEEIRKKRKY